MMLLDLAISYKSQFYPFIPYRTGRLANTGMSDIYSIDDIKSIGIDFCRNPGLQYGIILNEAAVITYRLNGREGSYNNRHFGYFDNFFDNFARQQAMLLGGEIIEGEVQ